MTEPSRDYDFDALEHDLQENPGDRSSKKSSDLPGLMLFATAALGVWIGAGVGIGYAIWG